MILIPLFVLAVALFVAIAYLRRTPQEGGEGPGADDPWSEGGCVIDDERTQAAREEAYRRLRDSGLPARIARRNANRIRICKEGTGEVRGTHRDEGRVPTDSSVRLAAIRAVNDIAATNPGCAPIAIQWLEAAQHDANRGPGFLGIPRAIRRARLGALSRELGSCIAGVDLTRFGFRDASQLVVTLRSGAQAELAEDDPS